MSAVSPWLSCVPAARILRLAVSQRHASSVCCSFVALTHASGCLPLRRPPITNALSRPAGLGRTVSHVPYRPWRSTTWWVWCTPWFRRKWSTIRASVGEFVETLGAVEFQVATRKEPRLRETRLQHAVASLPGNGIAAQQRQSRTPPSSMTAVPVRVPVSPRSGARALFAAPSGRSTPNSPGERQQPVCRECGCRATTGLSWPPFPRASVHTWLRQRR